MAEDERDPFAFFTKPVRAATMAIPTQWNSLKKSFSGKSRHFNFIYAHYIWIVGLTFIGSFVLYGSGHGQLPYIDALFLSSGANTQAGLNTVDINTLTTFQQVVLYILAMTSNPITINTSVVFLRLYWFEKHFQTLVREARTRRSTMSKSKSRAKDELDMAERGADGQDRRSSAATQNGGAPLRNARTISFGSRVGPNDQAESTGNAIMTHSNDTDSTKISGAVGDDDSEASSSNNEKQQEHPRPMSPTGPTISFAKTVKRSDGENDHETNFKRKAEEHIAILERQRQLNDEDGEVLRIPGPRDAERGIGPKKLEEGDRPDEEEEGAETRATPGARIMFQEPTRPAVSVEPSPAPSINPVKPLIRRITTFRLPRRRKRDEAMEEAAAIGNALAPMSLTSLFRSDAKPAGPNRSRTFMDIKQSLTRSTATDMPYLSWTPTNAGQVGRNSRFHGLTLEQREELGGIEYRSLRTLAVFLLGYFWGFSLLGVAFLLPYIYIDKAHTDIPVEAGVTKTWWGIFTANSAFTDLGFTLTPDSMISFQQSALPLIIMSFLIFWGNSAFPVMLRFCLWAFSLLLPKASGLWEEVRFLLDHPRRCFTMLFPSTANWWLFWVIFGLNALDLLLFVVLDLNTESLSHFSIGQRVYNGLFQAASTRTAGFASVNIADLHPAVQTSYMIMMYISVFPIAISIRRTNVYEERSLGIQEVVEEEEDLEAMNTTSYIGNHLRRQLSFDLWYVFAGLFILAISEAHHIESGAINLFSILFEVISAYGTVGLSLGFPGVNASLSSQFTVVGKLVIILMQIRGRHRGLPYGLDRAIMLPSEERLKEETEMLPVLSRTNTGYSTGTGLHRRTTILQRRPTAGGALKRMPTTLPELKSAGVGIRRSMTRSMGSMLMPGPPPPPRPRSRGGASFDARSFDRRPTLDDLPDNMSGISPTTTRRGSRANVTFTTNANTNANANMNTNTGASGNSNVA